MAILAIFGHIWPLSHVHQIKYDKILWLTEKYYTRGPQTIFNMAERVTESGKCPETGKQQNSLKLKKLHMRGLERPFKCLELC